MITVGILTVSTLGAAGQREDTSGEAIRELVTAVPLSADVADQRIVPDDRAAIESVLRHWADDLQLNLVLTTGGTGLSPTDVTPEATLAVIDRNCAGAGRGDAPGKLASRRRSPCSRAPSRDVAGRRSSSTCPAARGACANAWR